ncbi:MFS transporter [Pantoea sp. Al-1710]|uniref:MFS transporter n=1 Tax=Candidatus Pantoea communis TaxID=2608354 RepID=A0ABX0RSF1_9GAMM|nr:MFS transporter [Pantoea communis]NIG20277.1 MFS transporter [Pantoea communis]
MSTATIALDHRHLNRVLLVASTGCALTVIDTNIVGVMLPTIAKGLHASFADMEWVIGAYVLSFSSLLLPAGSLADKFGRRRLFLGGILLFALASLACGMATSVLALNIARTVQGIGSAFLLAPALAIIAHSFRDSQARNRAWAIWGGVMGLTMVLAPLAGGMISTLLGWRWTFLVNIPICALLMLAVTRHIEESRHEHAGKLDLPGIALFIAGMFCLTWALILAPQHGWLSREVVGRLCLGALWFGLFIRVESGKSRPMLNLQLFRSFPFIGAVLAMFAYAATAQVMTSLLPLLLQNVEGMTPLMAGAGMLPFALAMLLFPVVARWLGKRLHAATLLALGLVTVSFGNMVIATAVYQHHLLLTLAGMALLGSGGGLLNGETQKAIMATVPPQQAGMASGISTTARFSGILLGFATLGAILAASTQWQLQSAMLHAQLPLQPGFSAQVIAGDFRHALAMYDAVHQVSLQPLIITSYADGFASMLFCAAAFALFSAIVVLYSARSSRQSTPLAQR